MSLSGHTHLQSQYSFMLHYKSVRNMQPGGWQFVSIQQTV